MENRLTSLAGTMNGILGPARPSFGNQQPAPRPVVAPAHAETAALIHHVAVMQSHLNALLANPHLGVEDCREEIVKMIAEAVSSGMVTAQAATEQLVAIPPDPQQQRAWVQQHLAGMLAAQAKVLNEHRAMYRGSGDWTTELQRHPPSNGQHVDHIESVKRHYQARQTGPHSTHHHTGALRRG